MFTFLIFKYLSYQGKRRSQYLNHLSSYWLKVANILTYLHLIRVLVCTFLSIISSFIIQGNIILSRGQLDGFNWNFAGALILSVYSMGINVSHHDYVKYSLNIFHKQQSYCCWRKQSCIKNAYLSIFPTKIGFYLHSGFP